MEALLAEMTFNRSIFIPSEVRNIPNVGEQFVAEQAKLKKMALEEKVINQDCFHHVNVECTKQS